MHKINIINFSYSYGNSTNIHFDNNVYFGPKSTDAPKDEKGISADPQFINPGFGVKGYKLKENSAAKGKEVNVSKLEGYTVGIITKKGHQIN